MSLVFIHGVANRATPEELAAIKQRDALFRTIVFQGARDIKNPDWGSHAVAFSSDLRWIPAPSGNEHFGAGDAPIGSDLGLGTIAKTDGAQAVDLLVMAALERDIKEAAANAAPDLAATPKRIAIAKDAADFLDRSGVLQGDGGALQDAPKGLAELVAPTDDAFGDALRAELITTGTQAYGALDRISDAVRSLGGLLGNGLSDLALRAKRRDLSRGVSLFLGDIFVYLGKRNVFGTDGTRDRIFAPIIADLVAATLSAKAANQKLIVVAHSLGGVILYDMLTDASVVAEIEQGIGGELRIDALFTVGSQPGFFADLGLYPVTPTAAAKLKKPASVGTWMNVFDYTDVFSFLCAPMFEDVKDFGYDTAVDLFHAHTAYFQRPSFYQRMRVRLQEIGVL